MQLSGEQFIPTPMAEVYAALNDGEILRRCIPGCESLEKKSDTELAAKITLKIGPVKASFSGEVTLSNLNPPHSYSISGKGSAGAAGVAKGSADVSLQEKDGGTLLGYKVNVQISGKIAQLGSRLIDSTAKRLAGQFFENLAACLTSADAADTSADNADGMRSANNGKLIIAAAFVIALVLAVVVLTR